MSKSIIEHINNITVNKLPADSYSESDWKSWSSFMVSRWLSMNSGLLEIVNEVQSLNISDKKQLYKLYSSILPKKKMFSKYVKAVKVDKYNPELVTHLSKHFEVGNTEIKTYLSLLFREKRGILYISNILETYGMDRKLIKKLIKIKK
tara:strand:- start:1141 stop:1584 length:444 start_codon:yes stop_codon:yes gene_type:complete